MNTVWTSKLRQRASAVLVGLLLLLAAANGGQLRVAQADTNPASGTPPTVSADALPTVQINGVVRAQAISGDTVYATGSFSSARPASDPAGTGETPRANLLAYSISTGNLVTGFNHSLNGEGRAVTISPNGKFLYVSGDFTQVDGKTHNHIVAFNLPNGTLDTKFKANVSNGQSVRAVAATNSTIYIGGTFHTINGASRSNLAAFNTTGGLLPWKPAANANVAAIILTPDKSKVVVGGSFSTLNGKSYYDMGALQPSGTGQPVAWASQSNKYLIQDAAPSNDAAGITSFSENSTAIFVTAFNYVLPHGNHIFGSFEGTAAISPTNGNIIWLDDCHGDTYDAIPIGPVLYSVSHAHDCEAVGGFPAESPNLGDGHQHALAETTTPDGVNGPATNGYVSFQGTPKSDILDWYPKLTIGTYTGQNQAAWSITGNSQYVALGGEFPMVNNVPQQGLVRFAIASKAPNKSGPQAYSGGVVSNGGVQADGTNVVSVPATWDKDNQNLTYTFYRDGSSTPIYSKTVASTLWDEPTISFVDTGLTPKTTHTYSVVVTDPYGNAITGTNRPLTSCHNATFTNVNSLCNATNETLGIGQSLYSNNKSYHLQMLASGNLALYNSAGKDIWDTGTQQDGLSYLVALSNGRFAVRAYGNAEKDSWYTHIPTGNGAVALVLRNNGSLVLANAAGQIFWASGTAGK